MITPQHSNLLFPERLETWPVKYLLVPFRLLFKVYFGLYFFLTLLLLYPLFYFLLRDAKHFKKAFMLKRFWALILQAGYLSWFRKKTLAPLPKGPFVICSNHTSYLDIIMMYRAIPHYFIFMGKSELLKWPLFKIFFKTMDIAVDRKSSGGSAKAYMQAKNELERGAAVAIFPEGTIPSDPPRLNGFKNGAFKLAIECQVPIVPVTFLSNWKMLSHTQSIYGNANPGISEVVIHPPIPTAGLANKDLVALRQQVYETIKATLEERWK